MTISYFFRAPRDRVRRLAHVSRFLIAIAVLLCGLFLALPSRPQQAPARDKDKRLSVYTPKTGYSVAVLEREGKDYVVLAEVLAPLGAVTTKNDGGKWKLSCTCLPLTPTATPDNKPRQVEAQFTFGKTGAKVRGRDLELGSRFLIEDGRGLLPLHSLPAVLNQFLDTQAAFHEPGRRLFLGSAEVRYTAHLQRTPTRLVLSFSSPVNPSVATEPGRLRMTFSREPLVATLPPAQALDDRSITGLAFNEKNGTAELAVSGTAPLTASFSDGGKTITITPLPQNAATSAPASPQSTATQAATAPPTRVLVLLDPGHGGNDRGAALGDMAEKDFTLLLARRLRSELEDQGIHSVLLRDADTPLSCDQRALAANAMHPAVYLVLHATTSSPGVRVYASDLPPSPLKPASLVPWASAQASYVQASSAIASTIAGELGRRQIASAALVAPVRPLNNVAAAAIAVEVGPPPTDSEGLASAPYQQSICNAIASAVTSLRARLEAIR